MPLAHSPHAPLNRHHPQPTGVCDRCSFLYPLHDLENQKQWAGTKVITRNIRCCPRCLDELQENGFRTIKIGPDPKPLRDPRPTNYPPSGGQQFILDDFDAGQLDAGNTMRAAVTQQFVLDAPGADKLDVENTI